jgi:hypothetical protein
MSIYHVNRTFGIIPLKNRTPKILQEHVQMQSEIIIEKIYETFLTNLHDCSTHSKRPQVWRPETTSSSGTLARVPGRRNPLNRTLKDRPVSKCISGDIQLAKLNSNKRFPVVLLSFHRCLLGL